MSVPVETKKPPAAGETGALSNRSVRALKILVAEDNASNQRFLAVVLAQHGHRVAAVANGREAVDAIQREAYDVVLMDANMPELDGIAATLAIRALPLPVRSIPIIALTADAL